MKELNKKKNWRNLIFLIWVLLVLWLRHHLESRNQRKNFWGIWFFLIWIVVVRWLRHCFDWGNRRKNKGRELVEPDFSFRLSFKASLGGRKIKRKERFWKDNKLFPLFESKNGKEKKIFEKISLLFMLWKTFRLKLRRKGRQARKF